MILECCGCETVFVRVDEYFSEDASYDYHPVTGDAIFDPNITTKYWPAPTRRIPPKWVSIIDIADDTLRILLDELYNALNADLRILAAIAARTTIDRAAELVGVPNKMTFANKLNQLISLGKISADERDTLAVLIDAGSAAAHRGWRPTPAELDTMMDVTESFLHRALILGDAIARLRASVPAKAGLPK